MGTFKRFLVEPCIHDVRGRASPDRKNTDPSMPQGTTFIEVADRVRVKKAAAALELGTNLRGEEHNRAGVHGDLPKGEAW